MEPPAPPRLFLVDGYALIYRAFFALLTRPLVTSRGENTSAVWGIANFLQRLLAKHRPEYLGWVHDSGLSFRHEAYPAYKATREKLTDELQADFDTGIARVTQLLDAYRIPVLTLEGYEADDVIGTLARQGARAGLNVVIVSGDKDFQQLVRERVYLLNPGRGGPGAVEEHWVGPENANERLGVAPAHVTDFLALVGDSSDNVPGVKGIGEKGAQELVAQFGDLESILAHAGEVTKKRPREALLAQADMARLSKELVTIKDDLPVALDLATLAVHEPDRDALRTLFVELEFHGLARAAGGAATTALPEPGSRPPAVAAPGTPPGTPPGDTAAPPNPGATTEEPPVTYRTVDTTRALAALVRRIHEAGAMSVDTETVSDPGAPIAVDPMRANLVSISVAVAPGEAYYLPFAHRAPAPAQGSLLPDDAAARAAADGIRNLPPVNSEALAAFRALLEDPAIRKTGQNAKYDLLVLRRAGIALRGLDFDTMLASYVLDPGRRSHGLDWLALQFLAHQMISYEDVTGKGRQQVTFDQVPVPVARDYSCEDADMTLRLRARLEPLLGPQARLYRDVELPLVDVLADMEWTGVRIDLAWFAALKTRFATERERAEREVWGAAGEEFNINSLPQLRTILFEKLRLPVLKKTATGPSTDASVLQELADQGHLLPQLLMEYRELAKLESTYVDALPLMVNPHTGRVHTNYSQTVAATGRLSSNDPNLQNIPIRRELGKDIRRGFVPREGWQFLAADYSQVELRLLAHLSGDPAFVAAFRAGGDIHRQTASVIFGVPLTSVTSEMRARAKTINFATIYGQGAHALSRQLKIEHAEAKAFIATYFDRFAGVRAWLDHAVEAARAAGYVQTIFGRRRYIPEIKDKNFNIRAFGERVATNAPIQGSAADLIKIAMLRIADALRAARLEATMLLQVHDELVFEAPPAELKALAVLVKREMEGAASLAVPLVVDIGTGANWLSAKG
ncbi:MAG: DNA polymerase I [Gemmatimonadetes bacterium]|nr:DNA polymerase I [Gemmatimonadota bacterium]